MLGGTEVSIEHLAPGRYTLQGQGIQAKTLTIAEGQPTLVQLP